MAVSRLYYGLCCLFLALIVIVINIIITVMIKVMMSRWQQSCEALVKNAFDWLLLDPLTLQTFINR